MATSSVSTTNQNQTSSAVSGCSSGVILYACTRCNSRCPFEDLSPSEMLCKNCRGSFVTVKCTYCRSEFQQDSKSHVSSICKTCEQNVKYFGKPTLCEYCNITAAFVGSKCQRCTHSEVKYGPPVTCDQCKQRCAFKKSDRRLCWLCTLSYKRALAKAKLKEGSFIPSAKRHHYQKGNSNGASNNKSNDSNDQNIKNSNSNANSVSSHSKNKRQKIEYVKSFIKTSNGTFLPEPIPISSNGTIIGIGGSGQNSNSTQQSFSAATSALNNEIMYVNDNVVAITQLREKIISLDRQLKNKNQELLKKDIKINELKSEISKEQRDCREKIQDMTRKHNDRLQELQQKNTNLKKQLVSLQKASKKSNLAANNHNIGNNLKMA